jgi:hypothetical protein
MMIYYICVVSGCVFGMSVMALINALVMGRAFDKNSEFLRSLYDVLDVISKKEGV